MLDEPFAGIDPITVQNIQRIIRKLRNQDIAFLITDHAAREILQIVDCCYVIDQGQCVCQGTPDKVKHDPEVQRRYLGELDPSEDLPGPVQEGADPSSSSRLMAS